MELCTCELCSFTSEDIADYIRRLLGTEDNKGESYEPVTKDLT